MNRRLWLNGIACVLIGLMIHRVWPIFQDTHTHRKGVHGGVIFPVGRDRLHVEAVLEPDGALSLYTLDRDESQVLEVENQVLSARLTTETGNEPFVVPLYPEPDVGDASGKTSRFAGKIPAMLREHSLRIDVPAFLVGGRRFNLTLALDSTAHSPPRSFPIVSARERELYLSPGGLYTAADIEANGRQVPSQKFRGFKAAHDFNPKPGDRLCPVTRTKAHPDCAWIIAGQTHHFCCPPCIDEFLAEAKADTTPPE